MRKRAPCAILYSVVVCSFLLCGKGARPWERISREKTAVRVSTKERTDCIAHDLLIEPGSGMRSIFRRCPRRETGLRTQSTPISTMMYLWLPIRRLMSGSISGLKILSGIWLPTRSEITGNAMSAIFSR